jgi:hypothetical protein
MANTPGFIIRLTMILSKLYDQACCSSNIVESNLIIEKSLFIYNR